MWVRKGLEKLETLIPQMVTESKAFPSAYLFPPTQSASLLCFSSLPFHEHSLAVIKDSLHVVSVSASRLCFP